MAIGERIRFFRNLRGMTQKYLGIKLGFSERTADIRMAQYEAERGRRRLIWWKVWLMYWRYRLKR